MADYHANLSALELFISLYVTFSCGFYAGAVVVNVDSFAGASIMSVLRGILGAFLWPVFPAMIIYYGAKGYLKEKK